MAFITFPSFIWKLRDSHITIMPFIGTHPVQEGDYFWLARDTPAIGKKGNWVSYFPELDFWPGMISG
jgi:hypothetical protein